MQNPGLKAWRGDESLLHMRNEISQNNSVKLERNSWKLTLGKLWAHEVKVKELKTQN